MYFEIGTDRELKDTENVKVTKYKNNTVDVTNIKQRNKSLANIIKINKDEYYNKKTGEVHKYKKDNKRNIGGLRSTMKKLQRILRNNFFGEENELFITLTTEEVVSSIEEIKKAITKFFRKLKRKYKYIEYVYVIELQEKRNSWHIHTLVKDLKSKKLFIDAREIIKMWNMGKISCNVKRVEKGSTEGVIRYMTKISTKENIPTGKQPYGKSKGILEPEVIRQQYGEFKQENKDYRKVYEETLLLRREKEGVILNSIKTENWQKVENKGEIENGKKVHNIKRKCRTIRNKYKNNEKNFRKSKYKGITVHKN